MTKKRKATLKDLNEFLQKSPKSLVEVDRPGDEVAIEEEPYELSIDDIAFAIKSLAESEGRDFRSVLHETIENMLGEEDEPTASDLLLLNTVMYVRYAEGE